MYDHTNRQMSAALRRLGFKKSDMALTRGTTGYTHPLVPTGTPLLLSYVNKNPKISAIGIRRWFPGVFTQVRGGFAAGPALWAIPGITTASAAWEKTGRGVDCDGYASQREILLRVARALAAQLEADATAAAK